jgi:ABC-type lipoprotein release transport system permease subunit
MAAGRLLQGTLYGVSARNPLTLSAVLLVLALVSCAASYVPARSASGIDPNVTLRCE